MERHSGQKSGRAVYASILDLPTSILDPHTTTLDLLTSILDLPTSILDLLTSILDLPTSILDLPTSILDLLSSILDLPTSIYGPQWATVQGRSHPIISGQVETDAIGASSLEAAPLGGSGGMPPQNFFGILDALR